MAAVHIEIAGALVVSYPGACAPDDINGLQGVHVEKRHYAEDWILPVDYLPAGGYGKNAGTV